MSERRWFVAEGIFKATVTTDKGTDTPINERLLYLVSETDQQSAIKKADEIGRGKEHSYLNEKGEPVNWSFVRLVDVTECIDQQFEDGAELKSIMTD